MGEEGSAVCGCVWGVFFSLHVCVEYVAFRGVCGAVYSRDGQMGGGYKDRVSFFRGRLVSGNACVFCGAGDDVYVCFMIGVCSDMEGKGGRVLGVG